MSEHATTLSATQCPVCKLCTLRLTKDQDIAIPTSLTKHQVDDRSEFASQHKITRQINRGISFMYSYEK